MPYSPTFEGPIQGYIANSINESLWKFKPRYDRDDLMQEGYLVFVRCAGKYPALDEPKHFMALFKSAWGRHCIDLAKKATKDRACVSASMLDRDDGSTYQRDLPGELENSGVLLTALRQAPQEVLMVLNLFLNAPAELLDLAQQAWERDSRSRRPEAGDEFINRCLGLPEGSRPIDAVKAYLANH